MLIYRRVLVLLVAVPLLHTNVPKEKPHRGWPSWTSATTLSTPSVVNSTWLGLLLGLGLGLGFLRVRVRVS